jgi:hypothetical protein
MVDENGQLYTIEGVAAAILMVFTAYLMLSSTTLYTPGETHVTDMQMEQLGNDALAMMDTSDGFYQPSPLEEYIHGDSLSDKQHFSQDFSRYLNTTKAGYDEDFHFIANISYRKKLDNSIGSYSFTQLGNFTGREHTVKVTRWVYVPNTPPPNNVDLRSENRDQSILLEVLLWRD